MTNPTTDECPPRSGPGRRLRVDQGAGPALHIDLQVHIDASLNLEQIDHIFASVARHLGIMPAHDKS